MCPAEPSSWSARSRSIRASDLASDADSSTGSPSGVMAFRLIPPPGSARPGPHHLSRDRGWTACLARQDLRSRAHRARPWVSTERTDRHLRSRSPSEIARRSGSRKQSSPGVMWSRRAVRGRPRASRSTAGRHRRRSAGRPRPSAATADHARPRGRARAHRARVLARQSNDGVRVRLEVEPPRGMALVPAVHRERDEVRAVLEVADDDAAFLPGLPPDGREAQRTPAPLVRRGPEEPAPTESVERSMSAPGRVHEPRWRDAGWSGCLCAHG